MVGHVVAEEKEEFAGVSSEELAAQRERLLLRAQSSVVVVDGVPIVPANRVEKLRMVLTKIFKGFGNFAGKELGGDAAAQPDLSGVVLPVNEDGSTKGFAFIRYQKPIDAQRATASTDGFSLDKSHTFVSRLLADVERVQHVGDTFEEPEFATALLETVNDVVDTSTWLLDGRAREQFCVLHGDEVEIYWQDSVVQPELDYARTHWTDSHVMWSPRGSYLTTFHRQGIALWGGSKWERVMKFQHKNVKYASFSPCERYLVTCTGLEVEHDNPKDPQSVIVWEVSTGRALRSFLGVPAGQKMEWPLFKWSHDGSMLARRGPGVISVYSSPDMGLLDKKSLKIPDVQTFEWSPSANILAYWTPEIGNAPARVTLVDLPSKREIRNKALFSVASIYLQWHRQGTYLCCKVDRLTKSKKGKFVNFELFRMTHKDIPVETMEYKESDVIMAFAWEPNGHRFAVMHNDTPGRQAVTIFTMEGTGGAGSAVKEEHRFDKRTITNLVWSPAGNILVLAGLGSLNGQLEWINVDEQSTIATGEHFMCTGLEWDSSGRFLATTVSHQRNALDNGYTFWNSIGRELAHESRDAFYQLQWRPRPPSLITPKLAREVRKNLRTYRERYEAEDRELKESRKSGAAARRRELREEWSKYMEERLGQIAAQKERRVAARNGISDDDVRVEKTGKTPGYIVIEEVVENIISIKEEVDRERGPLLNSDDERD
mmetsp:Transcript_14524/g.38857  ORF Transcript_14524/g.38857 Transcript_14524/m.38857 type:complete len:714 (+) Transcript_14524:27-2168(+)